VLQFQSDDTLWLANKKSLYARRICDEKQFGDQPDQVRAGALLHQWK
jgi:hypothetical protein